MARTASALQGLHQLNESRQPGDRAVLDRVADPHQFLFDDTAGADRQMADLGVAHLAGGQTDIAAGGLQERMRAAGPYSGEVRHPCEADGIVGGRLAPAEPVEDHQHYGFGWHGYDAPSRVLNCLAWMRAATICCLATRVLQ